MKKVTVNGKKEYVVEFEDKAFTKGTVDGTSFEWDIVTLKEDTLHIILNNKSYTVEVLEKNIPEKKLLVRINGNKYSLAVKDKYDELLKSLGMDASSSGKVNELKAPMPGLVLDVLVKEGDHIKQGDSLLVLEAMKMENVLKATADVIVKKINVNKRMAVEKNQVLIAFE